MCGHYLGTDSTACRPRPRTNLSIEFSVWSRHPNQYLASRRDGWAGTEAMVSRGGAIWIVAWTGILRQWLPIPSIARKIEHLLWRYRGVTSQSETEVVKDQKMKLLKCFSAFMVWGMGYKLRYIITYLLYIRTNLGMLAVATCTSTPSPDFPRIPFPANNHRQEQQL